MLICCAASEKMGFEVVRFVLECDGTEFDNEEELMAFCDASTILMGLRENEVWSAACQATVSVSDEPLVASPSTSRGMYYGTCNSSVSVVHCIAVLFLSCQR